MSRVPSTEYKQTSTDRLLELARDPEVKRDPRRLERVRAELRERRARKGGRR